MQPDAPGQPIERPAPNPGNLPTERRALLAGLGGLAAGAMLVGGRTAHAGPLNPPAGPVTSTGKTLSEVEPRIAINQTNTPSTSDATYRITQPGSYYLTANLAGEIDKYGILIESSDVSIDLCGFAVVGVGGIFTGIAANTSQYRNIIVRNGIIRNWGGSGLQLISGQNALIEHLIATENGSRGISVGTCGIVRNCVVHANGHIGIECSHSCIVDACTVRDNGNIGLQVGNDCVITNCTAVNNSSGFALGERSVTRDCTAQQHTFNGFLTSGNSRFENCSAEGSGFSGFSVSSGCSLIGCSARNNTTEGFRTTDNCMIQGCQAVSNGLDGIRSTNRSIIRGNLCSLNGTGSSGTAGAGIHTTGVDNRIEDNNCTGNGRGIDCDSPGSFIVRNTCSGNTTNWDLAADNRHGGISNVTALSNPAVVGMGGAPTAITTENPWGNFSY